MKGCWICCFSAVLVVLLLAAVFVVVMSVMDADMFVVVVESEGDQCNIVCCVGVVA